MLFFGLAFSAQSTTTARGAQGSNRTTEYKVKAAYIYHFCRYIRWPATAFDDEKGPLVIGVLGPNPFGSSLRAVANKKVGQRPIEVRHFPAIGDFRRCHILFVSAQATAEIRNWAVENTKRRPVLLIGEASNFAQSGGEIGFFIETGGTIGFEINTDALREQQLKVSAKLLRVGNVVRDPEQAVPQD